MTGKQLGTSDFLNPVVPPELDANFSAFAIHGFNTGLFKVATIFAIIQYSIKYENVLQLALVERLRQEYTADNFDLRVTQRVKELLLETRPVRLFKAFSVEQGAKVREDLGSSQPTPEAQVNAERYSIEKAENVPFPPEHGS